jgi:haloalkane dehalogenase
VCTALADCAHSIRICETHASLIEQTGGMNRRSFLALSSLAAASLTLDLSSFAQKETALDADWYAASRQFASLSLGRIAYVEHGHNSHAALFLHGFPLNSFQWRGALERLAPYRRCIAPDLMGMGYSEIPSGQSITPATQVEMLNALLEKLRVREVDVVANDSGGLVAQLFIAKYPKRVRSLLLSNCDVDKNNPPATFLPAVALARRGQFAERYLEPQVKNKQVARSPRGIGAQFTYPDKLADSTIDFYFQPLISSPARRSQLDAYTVALGESVLPAVSDELHRWNRPARMVWAMKDVFFGVEGAEWLDRTFPGSRGIRRLDDANLFFPEEMPDVIAEEAIRLWA